MARGAPLPLYLGRRLADFPRELPSLLRAAGSGVASTKEAGKGPEILVGNGLLDSIAEGDLDCGQDPEQAVTRPQGKENSDNNARLAKATARDADKHQSASDEWARAQKRRKRRLGPASSLLSLSSTVLEDDDGHWNAPARTVLLERRATNVGGISTRRPGLESMPAGRDDEAHDTAPITKRRGTSIGVKPAGRRRMG